MLRKLEHQTGTITSLLGQQSSNEACLKLWEFLQSPTLLRNYMFCLLDRILWHTLRVTPQAALYRERNTQRKKAIQRRVRTQSKDETGSSSNNEIAVKIVEEAARFARARALRRRSVRLVGGTFQKL